MFIYYTCYDGLVQFNSRLGKNATNIRETECEIVLGFLSMILMTRLYSIRLLDDRNGDELEMTWKKVVVTYSMYYPGIWVKPRRTSVKIACVLAEIRNKGLTNTNI
jgi:hypothetical protein